MSRKRGPGALALAASVLFHVLLLGVFLFGRGEPATPRMEFRVYRVNIVSPPPQAFGEPAPQPVVSAQPPRVVKPQPEPAPEPESKKPQVVEKPTPAQKQTEPTRGPTPQPGAKVGGEGLNVQLAGENFAYPGYLENIIRQINRYFRWTGAPGLEAEIYFIIREDGSVTDIRIVRGSGDLTFDFEAMAAIEQAGKRKAFGPLPRGFAGDRLPISFYFQPAR
ncbi:MAG: energy transducer TonB [Gemmatimonadetes bacterium]|nr:energy transducer TonB [Gemmatimonadota bacterium]